MRETDWLSLAAAPTFATMALLTNLGGSAPEMLCMTSDHWLSGNWLIGMTPMYVLMSAFHAAPWLKLIFNRDPYNKEVQS